MHENCPDGEKEIHDNKRKAYEMKKYVSIFICLMVVLSMVITSSAMDSYDSTIKYLKNKVTNPSVSSVGGEWTIIGLARSGKVTDSEYFARYYSNAENYIKSKNGVLSTSKYTEYSRVIIAMTAIGKNPKNVVGYNLVEAVMDYDKVIKQGLNGPVWALIALDSGNYGNSEIRDKYISYILSRELAGGGWSFATGGTSPDADMTSMVLTSLAPYKDRKDVKMFVDRGIKLLSNMQNRDGGYSTDGAANSESSAQVLTAISSLGISYEDPRFIKNGNTIVDNIISYRNRDGSFSHTTESNLMATEQCLYSLVSVERLENGDKSLYDMSDAYFSGNDVSVPGIIYRGVTFDDIKNHKCRNAVERLAERGIINGISEGCFAPDNTMTRAEFATITVRALGLPLKSGDAFIDVKPDDWFYKYVNTACSYGIVKGVSDTQFNPQGRITREQAAVMMCRAAKLCGMKNLLNDIQTKGILAGYSDYDKISSWAESEIAFCLNYRILVREEKNLMPGENVKRCEIAEMIFNMLRGVDKI